MYKRGRVPSWVRVHKESDQFSRYGCVSGMSGDQIMYASQASECLFIVDQSGEQKIKVCAAKILPENMHGHYDEMLIKFTNEEAGKLERHYNLGTGLCNQVFSIKFEVKHFYFDLLHDSLKSLSPHQIDKVVPPVSVISNYFLGSRSFQHFQPVWYDFLKLDEQSQQPALKEVVSSNYQIPVLVSGAFGTGKTRLLAVATYQFIEEGKRTKTPTRVLLCCHHQVTADTFLNEYFGKMVYHKTNPWKVTLVRLTRARYKAEKIEYYNLCLTNKAFKEMFSEKYYAQKNYVVVVTTFATALNVNNVVGDKYFTHILFDEAAQVREPEAIAPLCMASEKTKIVIAGDDQQVSLL